MPPIRRISFISDALRAAWAPCIVVAIAVFVIGAFGSNVADALRYERSAVLQGQFWRLVTGNLVHIGPTHLALNLAGLALVCGLYPKTLTARQWSATLFICALTVTLGLLVFSPQIAWYVGLSGVLHGLFVAGALVQFRHGRRSAYVYLVLIGVKLALELVWGSSAEVSALIGGDVIVVAHLYGAIGGFTGLAFSLRKY